MKPKRINIEFGNYGTLITAHVCRHYCIEYMPQEQEKQLEIVSQLMIDIPEKDLEISRETKKCKCIWH
ncbi:MULTISPECIES: hypothetical protein [Streptococcaceae]|jgi:hypothetical protein|uniref:Uncharacterized protein n=1 Tax=Pseudolactococcus chungangensis TaxID=451457 RepID=A0A847J069_9LACT|nr:MULTISPECIES: hypothetical protein [Lactococcus]MCJ1980463.1 hypothetical protein [Lactococcus carnosus]NLH34739.1 hypothetical protein [Lactococcus chungangensis]QIW61678.1 hypothetical protein GU333_11385 [Lactococcus raffinolactis]